MTSENTDNYRSSWQAEGSLMALALVWGTSHVITKDILATHSPSFYTTARFGLAAIFLLLVFWRHIRRRSLNDVGLGILLGLCSFAGIAFYVSGLIFTQVSKAGFISGLYLVFTPIAAFALFRARPGREHLAGLAVAMGGFLVMSLPGGSALAGEAVLNVGDLLVLMAAIAWAVHIAATTAFAIRSDVRTLAVVQVVTVAVMALLIHLTLRLTGLERSLNPIDGRFLWQIGYMSIIVTCLAALIQTGAQKRVPSTHAAILYTLEPVTSAIFAYLVFGEELGARRGIGAALILLGVIISRLGLPGLVKRPRSSTSVEAR
ncbi:MAG: DMT family transporter [Blastocatellia bacterium]|jgi:drug/metabolite transporter (DMT)-like permease